MSKEIETVSEVKEPISVIISEIPEGSRDACRFDALIEWTKTEDYAAMRKFGVEMDECKPNNAHEHSLNTGFSAGFLAGVAYAQRKMSEI